MKPQILMAFGLLPAMLLTCTTGCNKTTPIADGKANDKDAPIVLERFKIGRHGEAILVPVTLNGKAFHFLLDTGANVTVFDSALPLGAAKRKNMVNSPAGPVEIQFFDAPDAKIGSLKLRTAEEIAGFDQGKLREVTGHEIYGVVGMDFLKSH